APEEEVTMLRRGRLSPFVSLCGGCTHISARGCSGLVQRIKTKMSLYQCLHERYGLQNDFADESAEASLASPGEARPLRIKKKAPVFRFTRTAYLRSGKPIEFVRSVYRGDRCKVVNRLSRRMEFAGEKAN